MKNKETNILGEIPQRLTIIGCLICMVSILSILYALSVLFS